MIMNALKAIWEMVIGVLSIFFGIKKRNERKEEEEKRKSEKKRREEEKKQKKQKRREEREKERKTEEKAEKMRGMDEMYLHMDSKNNPMVINGVMYFEELVEEKKFQKFYIENCINKKKNRRFKQIPKLLNDTSAKGILKSLLHWSNWIKIPFVSSSWEYQKDFKIENHIVSKTLKEHLKDIGEEDFDEIEIEEGLKRFFAFKCSQPMDKSLPLWKLYLIDINDQKNHKMYTVMLTRIHHGVADGLALVDHILDLTSPAPPLPSVDPLIINRQENTTRGGGEEISVKSTSSTSTSSLDDSNKSSDQKSQKHRSKNQKSIKNELKKILKLFILLLLLPFTFIKFLLVKKDKISFLSKGKGSKKAVAWSVTLKLDEVKKAAKLHNATVNDVITATASLALRRYSIDYCGQNPPPIKAFVPIGNAFIKNRKHELENNFGFILLTLPLHLSSPILTLNFIKKQMDQLKNSFRMMIGYYLSLIESKIVAPVWLIIGSRYWTSRSSLVFSNVKGPEEAIALADYRISKMLFFVPQADPIGLGVSIFSYNGNISLSILCDSSRVLYPDKLMQLWESSFYSLYHSSL